MTGPRRKGLTSKPTLLEMHTITRKTVERLVDWLKSHRTKNVPPPDCSSGPSHWLTVFKETVPKAAVIVLRWPRGGSGDMRCL